LILKLFIIYATVMILTNPLHLLSDVTPNTTHTLPKLEKNFIKKKFQVHVYLLNAFKK